MFRILGTFILSMVLTITSFCGSGGPLSKLDSTLDYAPLFFQGLVISGAISQTQATVYTNGVNRFEEIADGTKTCLSANIKSDAQCYLDMGVKSHAAIAEFYPAVGNNKVSQYVALVSQIVDMIISKNVPSVGGPVGISDQSLDAKIDELNRLLKSEIR